MKKRTLHVVRGTSAKSHLSLAQKKMGINDCIVALPFDFSYGYIPKDFCDKELCYALASHNQMGLFDQLKAFVSTDYSKYDKVIVWHGWAADELLMLYLMSVLVKGILYHIKIDKPYLGYLSQEELKQLLRTEVLIANDEKQHHKNEWHRWATTEGYCRLSEGPNEIIKNHENDFLDRFIFNLVENDNSINRIVGEIMEKYQFNLPGNAVIKRILMLWKEGVLKLSVSFNY